jgi:hypothetical protein
MEIDLSVFDLKGSSGHHYFEIHPKNGEYYVFNGKFDENLYDYFIIPGATKAGELCKLFYEKYYIKNEKRFSLSSEADAILAEANKQTNKKLTGDEAYHKYWNSLTVEEKLKIWFPNIPQFEALKDWYSLSLKAYLEENKSRLINDDVKKIAIEKWNKKYLTYVENALSSPYCPPVISIAHAKELYKFYRWFENNSAKPQNDALKNNLDKDESYNLIKPELHRRLEDLEKKVRDEIQNHKSISRIRYAAFCELLYEHKYFIKGATRIKTLNDFAVSRYGLNIEVQLQASKKVSRAIHKKQLNKLFA